MLDNDRNSLVILSTVPHLLIYIVGSECNATNELNVSLSDEVNSYSGATSEISTPVCVCVCLCGVWGGRRSCENEVMGSPVKELYKAITNPLLEKGHPRDDKSRFSKEGWTSRDHKRKIVAVSFRDNEHP